MMSSENPALEASANAASGAMRLAESLRSAVAQQQKLQEQKTQEAKADALKRWASDQTMRKGGYTPWEPPVIAPDEEDPNSVLKKSMPAGLTDPDPWGRRWAPPAPKPEATPQQTSTDLAAALEKGGQPLNAQGNIWQDSTTPRYSQPERDAQGNWPAPVNTNMFGVHVPPPDESQVRPIPGTNGVYMPTQEEQDQRKATAKAREAGTDEGAKLSTLPDAVTTKWEKQADLPEGTLKGLKVPPAQLREVISGLAGKSALPHIVTSTDNDGNVTTNAYDAQTGEKKWSNTEKGVGPKRKDPDAAPKAGGPTEGQKGVQARFDQKEVDAGVKQHDALQDLEQKQHDLRLAWGQVMGAKDGESVIDPKTGNQVVMSKARREAYQRSIDDAGKAVTRLQEKQTGIRKRFGWGEFEGEKDVPATAAPPASQGETAPPAKTATAPAASAKPATAKGATGRIHVKLSNGRTGTVDAGEFDAKSMTKL
jgi:hypothetical protein